LSGRLRGGVRPARATGTSDLDGSVRALRRSNGRDPGRW
jgi:hypothetical protein